MHCSSASLLAHTYMYCGESRVGSESRNVMVGSMVDFACRARHGARGGRDLQKWSVSLSVDRISCAIICMQNNTCTDQTSTVDLPVQVVLSKTCLARYLCNQ